MLRVTDGSFKSGAWGRGRPGLQFCGLGSLALPLDFKGSLLKGSREWRFLSPTRVGPLCDCFL